MASKNVVYEITAKPVTGKHNSRTNRLPFRAGSHNILAEVQQKDLMIYQNGSNGQPQQPAVNQLAHRGRGKTRGFGGGPGSGTSSGYSSRDGSATPTLSDDGSTRQQQQQQRQNKQQAGVDTVRISIEQPNIVMLANDSKKPLDATIDNNTVSAGKQYNIAGSAADVLELMRILKG